MGEEEHPKRKHGNNAPSIHYSGSTCWTKWRNN